MPSAIDFHLGQHLVEDFSILTAGATPRVSTDTWSFSLCHRIRPVQNLDLAGVQATADHKDNH
jgi:hypothetical protein